MIVLVLIIIGIVVFLMFGNGASGDDIDDF